MLNNITSSPQKLCGSPSVQAFSQSNTNNPDKINPTTGTNPDNISVSQTRDDIYSEYNVEHDNVSKGILERLSNPKDI